MTTAEIIASQVAAVRPFQWQYAPSTFCCGDKCDEARHRMQWHLNSAADYAEWLGDPEKLKATGMSASGVRLLLECALKDAADAQADAVAWAGRSDNSYRIYTPHDEVRRAYMRAKDRDPAAYANLDVSDWEWSPAIETTQVKEKETA